MMQVRGLPWYPCIMFAPLWTRVCLWGSHATGRQAGIGALHPVSGSIILLGLCFRLGCTSRLTMHSTSQRYAADSACMCHSKGPQQWPSTGPFLPGKLLISSRWADNLPRLPRLWGSLCCSYQVASRTLWNCGGLLGWSRGLEQPW